MSSWIPSCIRAKAPHSSMRVRAEATAGQHPGQSARSRNAMTSHALANPSIVSRIARPLDEKAPMAPMCVSGSSARYARSTCRRPASSGSQPAAEIMASSATPKSRSRRPEGSPASVDRTGYRNIPGSRCARRAGSMSYCSNTLSPATRRRVESSFPVSPRSEAIPAADGSASPDRPLVLEERRRPGSARQRDVEGHGRAGVVDRKSQPKGKARQCRGQFASAFHKRLPSPAVDRQRGKEAFRPRQQFPQGTGLADKAIFIGGPLVLEAHGRCSVLRRRPGRMHRFVVAFPAAGKEEAVPGGPRLAASRLTRASGDSRPPSPPPVPRAVGAGGRRSSRRRAAIRTGRPSRAAPSPE